MLPSSFLLLRHGVTCTLAPVQFYINLIVFNSVNNVFLVLELYGSSFIDQSVDDVQFYINLIIFNSVNNVFLVLELYDSSFIDQSVDDALTS